MSDALHEVAHGPGLREIYVFINILTVGLIVFFAGKKGFAAMLKSRADTVAQQMEDSFGQLEKLKAEMQEMKKELSNLEGLKAKFISDAEKDGNDLAAQVVKDAQITAERIVHDAKLVAENETKAAMERLRAEIVSETVDAAAQTLNRDHRDQIHQKFVSDFLAGGVSNGH